MATAVDLNEILDVESSWFSDSVPVDRSNVDSADAQGFDTIDDRTITRLCGAPTAFPYTQVGPSRQRSM